MAIRGNDTNRVEHLFKVFSSKFRVYMLLKLINTFDFRSYDKQPLLRK